MKTKATELFGMEYPLFAFSHTRNVVVEVTNAGGFGVLGGSSHTPEQLDEELTWIDEQVGGKPYGVDIVIPGKYEGKGQHLSQEQLVDMVPEDSKKFVVDLLQSHGVDVTIDDLVAAPEAIRGDQLETGEALLEVAFRHPIKFVANALGVPPQFMIDRAKKEGVPIGALVGAKEHALKQVAAGVDILVAQGTEAGGHCGEVSTLVVVPEIIEATHNQVPVLAAGGIVTGRQMAAAIALGAAGVWTGSVWLTTPESEVEGATVQKMLAASSRDTRRSKARTGKPSRQLKSDWTEAWEQEGAPVPPGLPLMALLSTPAFKKIDAAALRGEPGALALASYWVGQGVGLINKQKSARQTVLDFVEDYAEAVERIEESIEG